MGGCQRVRDLGWSRSRRLLNGQRNPAIPMYTTMVEVGWIELKINEQYEMHFLFYTSQFWERFWSSLYIYIICDFLNTYSDPPETNNPGWITHVVWTCVFQPQAVNTENLQSALFEAGVMRRSAFFSGLGVTPWEGCLCGFFLEVHWKEEYLGNKNGRDWNWKVWIPGKRWWMFELE